MTLVSRVWTSHSPYRPSEHGSLTRDYQPVRLPAGAVVELAGRRFVITPHAVTRNPAGRPRHYRRWKAGLDRVTRRVLRAPREDW
ncbi:MAG: hypothetical protein ACRCZP_17420 [Phycicoccus sp.]